MNYPSFVQSILDNPTQLGTYSAVAIVVIILIIYFATKASRANEKLKYDFITIITHKFRTPLSHVKWSLDELINSEQDPYKKEVFSEIQKSNENLIKLTATLIDLTNSKGTAKSSYHFEKINLCEMVRERGENLKAAFHEKNLFFSVQCDEGEHAVLADRARMEFLLQALLENTYTYSPPGRNVGIVVGQKGKKVLVSVTDNGIGIRGIDLGRIFSKFFRAPNARAMDTEGFGISLFLAQSIAKKHKGKIEAFSEGIGKGSTFLLTLPRA